ncbi:MAG: SpoIID/LytB domain-containing protein [Actinobacteria bacterium]|nr:SpoIID/LytB domain-containing protein [Actinomycetota bacterium]
MLRRVLVLATAVGLLAALVWQPPAGAARRKRLGAAVTPLRLVPAGSETMAVSGLHSYFGTIELDAHGGGLVVSDRLPLERYLLGLGEVPSSWPPEALKAQAVAARTYALYTLSRPRAGAAAGYGFDICASVQCQVFTGADTVLARDGLRWAEAVAETDSQTILHRGSPILARYHSTSGGRTLLNSQAFPEEEVDYPFLRPVESSFEEEAPLYRWRVDFTLGQIQRMLRRAGWWPEAYGRLRRVVSVESAEGFHHPDLVFTSRDDEIRRTAQEVRELFGRLAPRMFARKHPAPWPTSSGRLPETWPSNRIEVRTVGRTVQTVGRGWGHGVGMSQWGAYGLAQRGASYVDILQHYYTDVEVAPFRGPDAIEVGVAWARPSVAVTGSFKLVDGRDRTLVRNAVGTWRFEYGGDGVAQIDPPAGFGLPLEVGIARSPTSIGLGGSAFITVALSRPAHVRTSTIGSPTGYEDPGARLHAAGRQRVVWLAPLEPGTYQVRVLATAGGRTVRSDPVRVRVQEPRPPPGDRLRRAGKSGAEPSRRLFLLVVAGIVAALVAVAVIHALGRMRS